MTSEVPQNRFDFAGLLRKVWPKRYAVPVAKQEGNEIGYLRNVKFLEDGLGEVVGTMNSSRQDEVRGKLLSLMERSEGESIRLFGYKDYETDYHKGLTVFYIDPRTEVFTLVLGINSLVFKMDTPAGRVSKITPYGEIKDKDDLVRTIEKFILVDPTQEEIVDMTPGKSLDAAIAAHRSRREIQPV